MNKPLLRLLLVEDNKAREEQFRLWLPSDVTMVWAKCAGSAIGVLERDRGRVYAGLMLDHDLQMQRQDKFTGLHVAKKVVEVIERDVPILVHSMNDRGGPEMVKTLDGAGFDVTRWPWAEMRREKFAAWLEEVREEFEAWADEG